MRLTRAFLIALALPTACTPPPSGFTCEGAEDCAVDHLCVDGECRAIVVVDGGAAPGDAGSQADAGFDAATITELLDAGVVHTDER